MTTTIGASASEWAWTDDLPTGGRLKNTSWREMSRDLPSLVHTLVTVPARVTLDAVNRRPGPVIPPPARVLATARPQSVTSTGHSMPTAVDRVQDPQEAREYKGGASSDPQARLSPASTA